MNKIKHILVFVLLCISAFINAQESFPKTFIPEYQIGKMYIITTIYDTNFKSIILEENENSIVVKNKNQGSNNTLYKSEIKTAKIINASNLNTITRFDDNYYTNYYLLTENALPFKKEGLSSTAHYFILDNITYSFNENWSISTSVLLFLPVSVGIKCSFKISDDIYFGANAFAYGLISVNNGVSNHLFGGSAKVTKGNNEKNFSLGVGGLAFRVTDSTQLSYRTTKYLQTYYLTFAYSNRFSKHASLSIENILFPQVNLNMTGVSIRWIINQSDHWNFGCYGLYLGKVTQLSTKSNIIPLPYLSYSTFFN